MTEDEILDRARRYAEERGWVWRPPVRVRDVVWERMPAFEVETHVGHRGMNARIVVSAADGTVLNAGYLGR